MSSQITYVLSRDIPRADIGSLVEEFRSIEGVGGVEQVFPEEANPRRLRVGVIDVAQGYLAEDILREVQDKYSSVLDRIYVSPERRY